MHEFKLNMLLFPQFSVSIYSFIMVIVYEKKDFANSLPLIILVTLLSDSDIRSDMQQPFFVISSQGKCILPNALA